METDPGRLSLGLQLIILLGLTLVNAFFAMAEMALVSLSKPKLKAIADDTGDGDGRAERVMLLLEEPTDFLSAIQVAITLAGFLSSALTSFNLSDRFAAWLAGFGLQINAQISVVILTVILSFFMLVLGELFPKRLAMINPERVAMASVGAVRFTKAVFMPFVKLLSATVGGLMKLFRIEEKDDDAEYMEEEIINLLETGQEQGEIDETGKEMIHSIFDLDDAMAAEIMTPRTDVYMISLEDKTADFVDEMLEKRHARVPVYGEDQDDIRGVLYLKDFIIEARRRGFDHVEIGPILKKPFFVPESKKINELLDEMQKKKQQIALLIDEYGGFSGVVTIEDILEEIVGNIGEDYEEEGAGLVRISENEYEADGLYNIDDLSEDLGIRFESEYNDTVGGFVTDLSGSVPDENSVGQELTYENCVFKILAVSERRIDKVRITVLCPSAADDQE